MTLETLISSIEPLNQEAMEQARRRQMSLAKPPESLGRLEDLSIQLSGITGSVHNSMDHTHLLVFAADNGVVEEGVSSAPQSVTLMQTINLTRAKTGASVLAKHFGSGITVCDVGVNAVITDPKVLNRKIAMGTQNIYYGPAMTREQPEASALHQLARGGEVADQTQHLMAAHRENGCIFIQHGVGLTRFRRREAVRRGKHVRHRGAELGRNVRQDLGQKLEVFFVKRHHKVRLLWESCSYPLQDGAIFVWKKVPQRDERNVR